MTYNQFNNLIHIAQQLDIIEHDGICCGQRMHVTQEGLTKSTLYQVYNFYVELEECYSALFGMAIYHREEDYKKLRLLYRKKKIGNNKNQ